VSNAFLDERRVEIMYQITNKTTRIWFNKMVSIGMVLCLLLSYGGTAFAETTDTGDGDKDVNQPSSVESVDVNSPALASILSNNQVVLPRTWTQVGGGGLNQLGFEATSPDLIAINEEIYATWAEKNEQNVSQIYVKKWDVRTQNWVLVGNSSLNVNPNENANKPKLLSYDYKLYAVWEEMDELTSKIRIKKFDNDKWMSFEPVGSAGLNYTVTQSTYSPEAMNFYDWGQKLYVVWEEVDLSGIHQIKGKAFNFQGDMWEDVNGGDALNANVSVNAYNPRLTVYRPQAGEDMINGEGLYVSWIENNTVQLKLLNGGTNHEFITKDSLEFETSGLSAAPALTVNSENWVDTLFAVYGENDTIQIQKYQGEKWEKTTPTGISDLGMEANNPEISSANGEVFATWNEQGRLRVKRQVGNEWITVDGEGFPANEQASPVLMRPQYTDTLYLAWEDRNHQIQVAWYSGQRVIYDGNGGMNAPVDLHPYLPGNTVVVSDRENMYWNGYTFVEWNTDPQGNGKSYSPDDTVTMLEDSDIQLFAQWEKKPLDPIDYIGLNVDPVAYADSPKMVVLEDKLYAVWMETDGKHDGVHQIRIKQFNEFNNTWDLLGNGESLNYDPDKAASDPRITSYKDTLYVIWQEVGSEGSNLADHIRIKKYEDGRWQSVESDVNSGLNVDTDMFASQADFQVFGDYLYAIWTEKVDRYANELRIVAKRYNGSIWETVDTHGGLIQGNTLNGYPQLEEFAPTKGEPLLLATWTSYEDMTSNNKLIFKKLNSDGVSFDKWSEVSSSVSGLMFSNLGVYHNELYATWVEMTSVDGEDEIVLRVYKWSGSDWISVDKGMGVSDFGYIAQDPVLMESGDSLYVSWSEWNNSPDSGFGRVKKYTADGWIDIVGGSLATNEAADKEMIKTDMISFKNNLYIIWAEESSDYKRVFVAGNSPTYKVTYDGNGHTSGTVPNDGVIRKASDSVTVLSNSGALVKNNYRFAGWNTQADGKGISYDAYTTFNMGTTNVVLFAQWTKNVKPPEVSQGGSSSGTGSGSSAPQIELITVDVENGSNNGEVISKAIIKRTTALNGRMSDEVTYTPEQADKTIEKLKATGSKFAKIVIPDPKDEVSELKVIIPKSTFAKFVSNNIDLEIYTRNARVIIPEQSLAGLTDDLYFRLVPVKQENERQLVEQRAKTEQVVREYAGSATITVVGRPMTIETNMQSRQVTLVLPLGEVNENQLADPGVFIEHSDGQKEVVRGEIVPYDKTSKLGIRITINKFSTFTIIDLEGTHKAYINGYPDGLFGPERPITRAEMAAILSRVFDIKKEQSVPVYSDIKASNWASDGITKATQMGLMNGYPDGQFRPEDKITRAEMASVASRILGSGSDEGGGVSYSDISGHWASAAIIQVSAAGKLRGYENGMFRPDQMLTRSEAVVLINKLLGRGPLSGATAKWSDVSKGHWAYDDVQEASMNHAFEWKNGSETWAPLK